MTDEIRTPAGRTLALDTTFKDGTVAYATANGEFLVRNWTDGKWCAQSEWTAHEGTRDECLAFLDARADETVAALLPPGAIVVSEERVRELAKVLVARVGPFCGEGDCGVCVTARDEFLSALRAGTRS